MGVGQYTYYEFIKDNTFIDYMIEPTSTTQITLAVFKSQTKGNGKRILCQTIDWIKEHLPTIVTIGVSSIPQTKYYKNRGWTKENAQEKLDSYYRSLGFRETTVKHDFEIGIDELKANCMASGGAKTRKSLKRRTRKIQRWPKKF